MLVDTDVLIWYLRGNTRAAEALEEIGRFSLSVVTYMELVQGMRNKQELRILRSTLAAWETDILMIDEIISTRSMLYVEQYFHSHAMRLADALIAATAVARGAPLLTANVKHYQHVPDLTVERFHPSP
jgi:predicted nucleic acid-binding protein